MTGYGYYTRRVRCHIRKGKRSEIRYIIARNKVNVWKNAAIKRARKELRSSTDRWNYLIFKKVRIQVKADRMLGKII